MMPELDKEPKPKKETGRFKERVGIFAAKTAIVGAMLWLVGGQFTDKIISDGIKPAIAKEGDELESALSETISKEDLESIIKVGCALHIQISMPTEEPTDLTELCQEYLPPDEMNQDSPHEQPVEIAQDTTYYVTTTTTQP